VSLATVVLPDATATKRLLPHIRTIHAEVKGEYGWSYMHKESLAQGIRVGKDRFESSCSNTVDWGAFYNHRRLHAGLPQLDAVRTKLVRGT